MTQTYFILVNQSKELLVKYKENLLNVEKTHLWILKHKTKKLSTPIVEDSNLLNQLNILALKLIKI